MRIRVVVLIVLAAWWVAAPADAKGPGEVTIDGVGLTRPISLSGPEDGPGTFPQLVEDMGFFPAVFKPEPDPMLAAPPTNDLGPKLLVTWRVPQGANVATLQQELYPFASGGPLTYTPPDQRLFGARISRGGWFVGPPELVKALMSLGMPDRATLETAASRASTPGAGVHDTGTPWLLITSIVAGGAALVLGTTIHRSRRRRTRLAAA